jgi:DNA polymerase-3 subunit delta
VADQTPVVYLLNGDDDFASSEFVRSLEASLGDPAMASMNISRLDGRSTSLDEVIRASRSAPFLAPKRLVLVTHPLDKVKSQAQREKFIGMLDAVPPTTLLVLVETRLLTEERERRQGKIHWLEEWAMSGGRRVDLRTFSLPRGEAMLAWIQARAKTLGGQFSRSAAERLASLVGDEPRLADQEIQKLLTYVDFARPVEAEDVDALTPDSRQGDIFAMVDALANRNGKLAQEVYHRLLKEQDALSIFAMIVRQFRLLLQAREVIDQGGREVDVARALRVIPFVAGKLVPQARRFGLPALERIYHKLLDIDEATKTGQMDGDLAIDVLIAALTR